MNSNNPGRTCCIPTALIILCCTLVMFGCTRGSTNTLAGKYVDDKNPQNFTEFKTDGSFSVHKATLTANGKYLFEGKRLILTLDTGEVFEGTVEGNTITGNKGGRSTKQ